ncbi:hypothetical protein J2Z63_000817, partial [Mycoplasma yeatsii]|nr:hypothetical protein [Mycoplasma yeatsii]
TKSDFEAVGEPKDNSITLKVRETNNKYHGSIVVNYSVRKNIDTLGLDTNAGAFNSEDSNAIIQKFIDINKDKLTGFDKDSFTVVSNENGVLTIKVNDDNNSWFGQIVINYSVRTNISTLELNRNAGAFNSFDKDAIIDAFINNNTNKIPGLTRRNFEVIQEQGNSIKVRIKDSNQFQGEITINYSIKTNINEIRELNRNAGSFNSKDLNQIIAAFISNNRNKLSGLTRNDLELVGEMRDNSLTVKVKDTNTKFQGQITIDFTIKTNISSFDWNTNAGAFNSYNAEEIINAFITNNNTKLDGLNRNNFTITENRSSNSITLIVKDEHIKYQGSITINYSIKTNISTLELNRNAGAFNSNEPITIIEKFINDNKEKLNELGLTRNSFTVVGNEDGVLTIKVNDDDNSWFGQVEINYSIKTNISTLNLNNNAGAFNSVEPSAIIDAFIRNNRTKLDTLTKADFEVVGQATNNSITLKVKDENQKYQGSITINYSIKTNISTLNLDNNAGAFNSYNAEEIINAFITNNNTKLDGLNRNNFTITENRSSNSITLIVKDEHIKYQGSITINYSIKTNISTLELNRNAGAFNSNEPITIIEKFINDNKEKLNELGLTRNSFTVVGNEDG